MSLPRDLLLQAELLARHDRTRPKQANLRRAISSAYYALFHLLLHHGARLLISGEGRSELRGLVARAFQHTEMRATAEDFSSTRRTPPARLATLLGGGVSTDLQTVADAFILLQGARHEADYNILREFTRAEAKRAVGLARQAFVAWDRVRRTPEAEIFLVYLLLRTRLRP